MTSNCELLNTVSYGLHTCKVVLLQPFIGAGSSACSAAASTGVTSFCSKLKPSAAANSSGNAHAYSHKAPTQEGPPCRLLLALPEHKGSQLDQTAQRCAHCSMPWAWCTKHAGGHVLASSSMTAAGWLQHRSFSQQSGPSSPQTTSCPAPACRNPHLRFDSTSPLHRHFRPSGLLASWHPPAQPHPSTAAAGQGAAGNRNSKKTWSRGQCQHTPKTHADQQSTMFNCFVKVPRMIVCCCACFAAGADMIWHRARPMEPSCKHATLTSALRYTALCHPDRLPVRLPVRLPDMAVFSPVGLQSVHAPLWCPECMAAAELTLSINACSFCFTSNTVSVGSTTRNMVVFFRLTRIYMLCTAGTHQHHASAVCKLVYSGHFSDRGDQLHTSKQ